MKKNFNKLLLAGDKFMPELHQRQLGFTYSTYSNRLLNIVKGLKILKKQL